MNARLLAPLLAVSALYACAADSVSYVRITCSGTTDCGPGSVCQAGQCLPASIAGPRTVSVELTPPEGSKYVRAQLLGLDLGESRSDLLLTLPEPTPYQIQVFEPDLSNGDRGPSLDARLTLSSMAAIPGRELDLELDLRAADFRTQSTRLLEDVYTVLIDRLDGRPSLDTTFTVRAPDGDVVTKEFRFRPYRRIYGEVTSSLSTDLKLEGVRVTAFSTRTGLPATSTVTGRQGRYAIELPDTADTEFRLIAVPPESAQPTWSYEELVLVERGTDREKPIPIEPAAGQAKGAARIRFGSQVAGEGFVPAVDASVTLTATTPAGLSTRVYRVQAATNNDGYVYFRGASGATGVQTIRLLSGYYQVEVVPRSGSRFGRRTLGLDLTGVTPDQTPDLQEILPLKTLVRGNVRSGLGRAVPFATVELVEVGSRSVPAQAATDETGAFEANVEAGEYLLIVKPSSHSDLNETLPVGVERITVKPDQPEQLVTISLSSGVSLFGNVRGGIDNAPAGDVRVEFFFTIDDRVVSLGTARTDSSGAFSAVLPESFGAE